MQVDRSTKRVAVIFVLGGSKRIPRKILASLCGRPIITYAVSTGRSSKFFDKLWVSKEDREIAEIAEQNGANIIDRPDDLADDLIPNFRQNLRDDNSGE